MKKICLLIISLVMLLCTSATVFANQAYKHPDYNLQSVREIHITNIENRDGEPAHRFTSDENAEIKVLNELFTVIGNHKMIPIDDTNARYPVSGRDVVRHNPSKLELRVIINHCGSATVHVPGHYEEYTEHKTHYYYDEKGNRHSYDERIPRQRWVEDSSYEHAYLSLIYNFYDMADGTMVASFSDSRDREYEDNAAGGMLNRSIKECFNKVFRK